MSDSLSDEDALNIWNSKGNRTAKQTGKMSDKEALALWDRVKPPEKTPEGPSTGRAMAEGALEGGTYGFGGELQGLIGALLRRDPAASKMLGYPTPDEMTAEEDIFANNGRGSFLEDYRAERNAAGADRKAAQAAHPDAYGGSQLAAAILTPGPKAGKGIGSFAKAGALAGGAYGLGASDADLTKGDVGGAALDTAIGTGLGAGTGAAAGALNKFAVQPLANKVAQMGAKAQERGWALANKPIDAAINSTRGALGGEVAAGSRGIEVAEKAATDAAIPEELSRRAADTLDDPAIGALKERVISSQLGQLAGRLPRIEKAQGAFNDAVEAGSPEAREAAYAALMGKSPLKRALWEIAKRTAPTIAGSAIGGALGGTAGAGVGGTLGLLTGAMSGRPGRLVTNALRSPQTQLWAADLGSRALEESIPGALEGVIGEQSGDPQSKLRGKLEPWLQFLRRDEQ